MAFPVTLKKLAELLHLAPSTVSRALKGHPDISEATQERVKELAMRLHYQPDMIALGLRKKNSYTLAILVPDLTTDFFYIRIVSAVIDLARKQGYKIVVFESHKEVQQEKEICHFLEKAGISGLLLASVVTDGEAGHLFALQSMGMPIVMFEHILGNLDTDKVLGNYYKGAYEAVSYMIEGGGKRIAHLTGPVCQIKSQKKQLGYIQALLHHQQSIDTALIAEYHPDTLEPLLDRWIRQLKVDSIFVVEDIIAVKILNILKKMDYKIPDEVAVCGYGNSIAPECICPALTTVDGAAEQIAQNALELLLERIRQNTKSTETRFLKNRLIVRETTRKKPNEENELIP